LLYFNPQPEEILKIAGSDADRQIERRLAAYWEARNAFLLAGIGVQRTDNVKELLQRVREPLMEVVRLNPDFTAAYKPLLAMAYRLSKTDPEAGEQLLLDLEKANPENDEARQLRLLLFRNGPMVSKVYE